MGKGKEQNRIFIKTPFDTLPKLSKISNEIKHPVHAV